MKIGMRTIKTAIAVALSVFLANILNLNSSFFAGIAAIITMQSTVAESFNVGKHRMLGTIMGAIVGVLFALVAPGNPIFIGIGIIILITLCNLFGWKKSVTISGIVFLSIMLVQEPGNRVFYGIYRSVDTFVGIIVAVLINYFILPPDIEKKLMSSLVNMFNENVKLIENFIWDHKEIKLDNMKKALKSLDDNYKKLKKEMDLNIRKGKNYKKLETILPLFENLYSSLKIISTIEANGTINKTNKENLEILFKKELPDEYNGKIKELDIVFNYHLKKVLDELTLIRKIINEKNDSVETQLSNEA